MVCQDRLSQEQKQKRNGVKSLRVQYVLYLKVADGLVPLLDVRASLNLVDGEASLADTLADLRVRRDTLCEDHRVHVWFLRCFLKRRSVVGSKVSSPTC